MAERYHICERFIFLLYDMLQCIPTRLLLERAAVRGGNMISKATDTVWRQAHLQERTKDNIHMT